MRFAGRMDRLGTESAFEVLAKARGLEAQGRRVIHLEIGEPDFDTPANIVEAGIRALRDGQTHYGPAAGIPQLREAVAENHKQRRGIDASPEQVVVTPGAKPIMFYVMLALLEEGDEVVYPNPGFPIYESVIRYLGARPVPIRPREERAFGIDPGEVREVLSERTRLVVLNYPQNPTGGSIAEEDLEEIATAVAGRGVPILVDEVYKDIVYEGEFHSLLSHAGLEECGILLDGFSKSYAMTGWRLGYGVMPLELARKVTQLAINCNSCTATFVQHAGVEALRGPQDEVKRMVAEFRRRRDAIVEGLNAIDGVTCPMPRGAFYVFPNIRGTGLDSRELEALFLEEAGVACLSGTSFGAGGDGYLRLSYANSLENIREALERIRATLERHRG